MSCFQEVQLNEHGIAAIGIYIMGVIMDDLSPLVLVAIILEEAGGY